MEVKCPKCRSENPAESSYCSDCGTKLHPDEEEISAVPTKTLKSPIEELETGSVFAGRYQVIEKLGEGGMGKVYKVIDKEIDATVALKLILPEIAADKKTVGRFRDELKIAREISHRNVCRMHDLNKEEETYYITMEYVPGEDLKSMIKMTKQLNVGKAIDLAKQVCLGLVEAHRIGVVHRDLKSSNIVIDKEGNARIMDFGIAQSLKAKGVTGAGVMIGTPEYMSPEQVEGKEVDQRSDIYSLGVILYEMVTGRLPFDGGSRLRIAMKHKSEAPRDPRELNVQIPEDISQVILRCMEKDKEKRYQNTEELLHELNEIEKRLPTVDSSISMRKPTVSREITVKFSLRKLILPVFILAVIIILGVIGWKYLFKKAASIPLEDMINIAVISFENQTGDNAYDYLQEAIPNLLITSLEQSKYIRVATWERMHDLLKQLGKEGVKVIDSDLGFELCRLDGIDAIVLGSFTKAEEMFATDAKVLDVRTKSLLKSASSRGDGVGSILRKQIDELSSEISRGIGLPEQITITDTSPIAEVTTDSMEAYNYFLRGREDYEKYYFDDARRFLEKAVELDPEFSMAYFYLGRTYGGLGNVTRMNEAFEIFKKFGKKLKGKEGLYAEAIIAQNIERDNEKYFKILKEITNKYPKEKRAHFDLAVYYWIREMFDEAINELNKTLELDPNFGYAINQIAYVYSSKNDFEKALEYFKRYASVSPGDANPFDSMGELYFRMGKLDEAIDRFKEALEVKPDFGSDWKIAYIYALKEDYAESMKWVDQYISRAPSNTIKAIGYRWKGFYHFILGNIEQSLKAIDKAEELGRSEGNTGLIDTLFWMKIWIYYELGKTELYYRYVKDRIDFRKENKLGSETLNKAISRFYLGLIDLKKGQIEPAKSKLAKMQSQLFELEPEIAESMKLSYDFLSSEILLAEGTVDEAVAIFKKISPLQVNFTRIFSPIRGNLTCIRDFLARAFQKKGEIDKAIAEYERLIIFNPDSDNRGLIHPKDYYRIARLYEQKGCKEKTIEHYEKFLDLWKNADPDIPEVDDARKRLAGLKSQNPKTFGHPL